jgi:hypothetical protein
LSVWPVPLPRNGHSSVNNPGCCATRPFFATQKIGTRTVLAASPGVVDYAERGLIVSGERDDPDLAPSTLPTHQTLNRSVIPGYTSAVRAGEARSAGEQSGRGLSLPSFSGAFCEHCSSPKNCAAILVELRSSPKMMGGLRPFNGRPRLASPTPEEPKVTGEPDQCSRVARNSSSGQRSSISARLTRVGAR